MVMRRKRIFILAGLLAIFIGMAIWGMMLLTARPGHFNGQRAYQDVIAQVAMATRTRFACPHGDNQIYPGSAQKSRLAVADPGHHLAGICRAKYHRFP